MNGLLVNDVKALLAVAAGALVVGLAGCASGTPQGPVVRQGVNAQGVKTVSVDPAPLLCSTPRCPMLGASWAADRPGIAMLVVGLPYQRHEVLGADFYLGPDGVSHVRSRSRGEPPTLVYPATEFDVPLRLISQIANSQRSWVRVITVDGVRVDESLDIGEERAQAAEAMALFLSAVSATGTKGVPDVGAPRGGLLDRLDMQQ